MSEILNKLAQQLGNTNKHNPSRLQRNIKTKHIINPTIIAGEWTIDDQMIK